MLSPPDIEGRPPPHQWGPPHCDDMGRVPPHCDDMGRVPPHCDEYVEDDQIKLENGHRYYKTVFRCGSISSTNLYPDMPSQILRYVRYIYLKHKSHIAKVF